MPKINHQFDHRCIYVYAYVCVWFALYKKLLTRHDVYVCTLKYTACFLFPIKKNLKKKTTHDKRNNCPARVSVRVCVATIQYDYDS